MLRTVGHENAISDCEGDDRSGAVLQATALGDVEELRPSWHAPCELAERRGWVSLQPRTLRSTRWNARESASAERESTPESENRVCGKWSTQNLAKEGWAVSGELLGRGWTQAAAGGADRTHWDA